MYHFQIDYDWVCSIKYNDYHKNLDHGFFLLYMNGNLLGNN